MNLRKELLPFLISLTMASSCFAVDTAIWLGTGYRQDELDWTIAGSNGTPNVMSELSWKDLQMVEVSGGISGELFCIGAYRINADYAWILHGRNRDSDYAGDNRTIEYSRSDNKASRGEAFDLKAGIGTHYTFCGLVITPLTGYALMEQHLTMYHGNQTIDLIGFGLGRFKGLHNRYNTTWQSPWVGIDLFYDTECDFTFYGSFEYHWPYYRAKGHWNLRTDFIGDFIHRGNGHGCWSTIAATYALCSGFNCGISGEALIFKIKDGTDTTKFIDVITDTNGNIIGEQVFTGRTKLNVVNYRSYRVQAFLSYVF